MPLNIDNLCETHSFTFATCPWKQLRSPSSCVRLLRVATHCLRVVSMDRLPWILKHKSDTNVILALTGGSDFALFCVFHNGWLSWALCFHAGQNSDDLAGGPISVFTLVTQRQKIDAHIKNLWSVWTNNLTLSIGHHVDFDTHASKFWHARQKVWRRPANVKTLGLVGRLRLGAPCTASVRACVRVCVLLVCVCLQYVYVCIHLPVLQEALLRRVEADQGVLEKRELSWKWHEVSFCCIFDVCQFESIWRKIWKLQRLFCEMQTIVWIRSKRLTLRCWEGERANEKKSGTDIERREREKRGERGREREREDRKRGEGENKRGKKETKRREQRERERQRQRQRQRDRDRERQRETERGRETEKQRRERDRNTEERQNENLEGSWASG